MLNFENDWLKTVYSIFYLIFIHLLNNVYLCFRKYLVRSIDMKIKTQPLPWGRDYLRRNSGIFIYRTKTVCLNRGSCKVLCEHCREMRDWVQDKDFPEDAFKLCVKKQIRKIKSRVGEERASQKKLWLFRNIAMKNGKVGLLVGNAWRQNEKDQVIRGFPCHIVSYWWEKVIDLRKRWKYVIWTELRTITWE